MPNGYCPSCKRVVMTKREDIDALLAIFLLFFTAGIGFFIYLLIYYSQPEDRCMFCGTHVEMVYASNHQIGDGEPKGIPKPAYNPYEYGEKQESEEYTINTSSYQQNQPIQKFCQFCGTPCEIDQKYCSACGADLKN